MRRTKAMPSAALLILCICVLTPSPGLALQNKPGGKICPEPKDIFNCRTTLVCIEGKLYCCADAPVNKSCTPEPTKLSATGIGGVRKQTPGGTLKSRGVEGEQAPAPAPPPAEKGK